MPNQGADSVAVTLGSAPDNDIVVQERIVSSHHARIVWDGQALAIQDLASTNGTFVNGVRITVSPVRVGDEVGMGSHRFTLSEDHLAPLRDRMSRNPAPSRPVLRTPTQERGRRHGGADRAQRATAHVETIDGDSTSPGGHPAAPASEGPRQSDSARSISLGYHDDNDVVIPLAQVSGYHCRIWNDGGRYILEDLGSTNGSWVNGERVIRAWVKIGDSISLGSYNFVLGPKLLSAFTTPKKVEEATRIAELPPGMLEPVKIGRDSTAGVNDIVLNAPMVSNEHAELEFIGQGWRVRDLGSTNGTYINSPHNRVMEGVVNVQDVLFFGSYRFPLARLAEFTNSGGAPDEMQLPTDKKYIVIGRDESCDITIDAAQVSRKHARLVRTEDGFIVEDLSSANGTFVNGKRIARQRIGPDDWVGLGSYQVRFDLEAGTIARNYHGDIMLQAESITVKVAGGKKTILQDVSFTVYPTEFVGLMGPSGAGKTTLMMALNGYLPPSLGRSRINGVDLYQNYNAFRGNIGYVPQDDIIHGELTVWEALYYTAKLRLPPDTRRNEIEKIIVRVLRQLEIEETRDVLIGSPEKKGISGGQRKRVNLALELITQPSLLFLDEPTSGLASEDTINVMRLLRRLADEGRTILLTIHQPSLEAYRKMDNIVYLADGMLVYYGPTYPDSITYFNPDAEAGTPAGDAVLADPGNALKPLAEDKRNGVDMKVRAQAYRQSQHHEEYVVRRRSGAGEATITGGSKQKARRRFGFRQWWTLTRRYLTVKRKDLAGTAILLLQAPIIATVISLVFWGETDDAWGRVEFTPFALFLLVVSAVWFGCSNSAREIVAEQAIYRRERMVNLKIPSYVMSKFTVLGFACGLQCFMLLVMTWPVLGFEGSFFEMYFLLLFCSLAGLGMGLVLSSLVRTSEAAIALVPLLLIPQVILGGMIMPIDKMSLPVKGASLAMVSRWGFEGMLHAEDRFEALEVPKKEIEKRTNKILRKAGPARGAPVIVPPPPPKPIERFFGDSETHSLVDCSCLCSFVWLMLFGVFVVLKIRDPEVG